MKTKQFKYYNSGSSLGIIGVSLENINHEDGIHTHLSGRAPAFTWIRTEDLKDTSEEAEKSEPAKFFGKGEKKNEHKP